MNSYCKNPPSPDSNLATINCNIQTQTVIQHTTLDEAVLGIVYSKRPCEVNTYCKPDILQVLIVTSSPFTSQSSRLGPKARTEISKFSCSLNGQIIYANSFRSHLLLCLPISKMPRIFPARWCLNFSHSTGWVSMVSKIHPFQEVGLNWLLAIFSTHTPLSYWGVLKIHLLQEVCLNRLLVTFSNVSTLPPLFHSFGAAM